MYWSWCLGEAQVSQSFSTTGEETWEQFNTNQYISAIIFVLEMALQLLLSLKTLACWGRFGPVCCRQLQQFLCSNTPDSHDQLVIKPDNRPFISIRYIRADYSSHQYAASLNLDSNKQKTFNIVSPLFLTTHLMGLHLSFWLYDERLMVSNKCELKKMTTNEKVNYLLR